MTVALVGRLPARRPRRAFWYSVAFRGLVQQAVVLAIVVGLLAYLALNAMDALQRQGIAGGFGYLDQEAGFAIGETVIPFEPSDSYLRAFVVGVLNTLKVSVFALIGATVIGAAIGLMRLSPNWGLAKLAQAYVEVFRNTPQLLQMILWYWILTRLPGPRAALEPIGGVFISNRGVQFPWPADGVGWGAVGATAVACMVAVLGMRRLVRRRCGAAGRTAAASRWLWLLLPVGTAAAWLATGAPTAIDWPALRGLNFRGGATLTPEFTALLLGLSLYIAAFIAEIVRSGIQSVGRGQIDAARALGLTPLWLYRLILIPQAMRVMIPPLAAQYVSLVKNSSLAVAIGYPDVVNISNTSLNQSGHIIEAIALMSAVYLFISLGIALLMNLFNRSIQLQER